jgi:hypothetical protein
VRAFSGWLIAKWTRSLEAEGMPGALAVGQDVHLVDGVEAAAELGQYLAKSTAYGAAESLGRELMGALTKTARSEHSTAPVWAIAERFFETGDLDELDLWREYERGSKGRRQIGWSRGLRDRLGIGVEATDEEIAEEAVGDEDLVLITAAGWTAALASGKPLSAILDVTESAGIKGLRAYLDAEGIEYELPSGRRG